MEKPKQSFWPIQCNPAILCTVSMLSRACAYSLSCVYNPMGCSPPDFSAHGILQASILEWVVIFFFRGSPQPRDGTRMHLLRLLHWQAGSLPLSHLGRPYLYCLSL